LCRQAAQNGCLFWPRAWGRVRKVRQRRQAAQNTQVDLRELLPLVSPLIKGRGPPSRSALPPPARKSSRKRSKKAGSSPKKNKPLIQLFLFLGRQSTMVDIAYIHLSAEVKLTTRHINMLSVFHDLGSIFGSLFLPWQESIALDIPRGRSPAACSSIIPSAS
jgi:hypothetical protein